MNQTIEEKIKYRIRKFGKKNKVTRALAIVAMFCVITVFRFWAAFRDNTKRLSLICVSFLTVVVYTSFSFSAFADWDNTTITSDELLSQLGSQDMEVSLSPQTEVDISEVLRVELDDDTEEFTDLEAYSEDDVDTYDINEILNDNEGREVVVTAPIEEVSDGITFSKDDWRLILINKQHPLPEDYKPPLGTITGSLQCDERIIDDLLNMLRAAKEDDVNLVVRSPYRSIDRQVYLFNRKITKYMNAGMTYMDAYKEASQIVTVPGSSEHQAGLALDITCDYYVALDEGFGETEAGIWLQNHCAEYGFILRYPNGKEYITGIDYEPWHFRYVGVEAATVIMREEITLEEFWEDL